MVYVIFDPYLISTFSFIFSDVHKYHVHSRAFSHTSAYPFFFFFILSQSATVEIFKKAS
jgi:hypothetical protein